MDPFWVVSFIVASLVVLAGIFIVVAVRWLVQGAMRSRGHGGSVASLIECPHCGKQGTVWFSPSGTPGFVMFEVKEVRCSMCGRTFIASKHTR